MASTQKLNTKESISEGIAEGYRSLRQPVRTLLSDLSPKAEKEAARKSIEVLIPIMEMLTGRTRQQLLEATIKRILLDAGLSTEKA